MNASAKEVTTTAKQSIVEFNPFEKELKEYIAKYDGVVYDLSDEKEEKQAKSDRLAIGKTISKLDSIHKELKAPLKEKVDLIDGERKRIKDALLGVQDNIKSQIKAHEDKIKNRAAELHNRVIAIQSLAEFDDPFTVSSEVVTQRLEEAKAVVIDESFDFREADAALAKMKTVESLQVILGNAMEREEKEAELEKLRQEEEARKQKEREEQIAKEAAEKAARDAEEKARRDIEEANKKAQQAAIDAENAAKAERERIEREQAEEQRKRDAEKAAEDARKAKAAHKKKIEGVAITSMQEAGFPAAQAASIIKAIASGNVKHVSIIY